MKLLKQIVLILIVLVGGGFAILNLVFILFFISKNSKRPEPRR